MSALDSSGTSSGAADEAWVSWYCGMSGNEVFCEADKAFIEDSFNLFGLKQFVPKEFNRALSNILDRQDSDEEETEEIALASSMLYGLIHARFIITTNGLQAMQRKYIQKEFGECPRTYCNGQAVLPMGMADEPQLGCYKLFCPKCRDIYNCPSSQRHIDGAYFGTSFPHIFLMTFDNLVPPAPSSSFVPRVFGFKIHSTSNCLPRQVVVLDSTGTNSEDGQSSEEEDEEVIVSGVGNSTGGLGRASTSSGNKPSNVEVMDLTSDPQTTLGVSSSGHMQYKQQTSSNNSGTTTHSTGSIRATDLSGQHLPEYQQDYAVEQYYDEQGRVNGCVHHKKTVQAVEIVEDQNGEYSGSSKGQKNSLVEGESEPSKRQRRQS